MSWVPKIYVQLLLYYYYYYYIVKQMTSCKVPARVESLTRRGTFLSV